MGDNKELYATLQSEAKVHEVDQSYNASIAICVRDILNLAKNCAYKFVWVPRNHVVREDKLAKEEREHNKPYTIYPGSSNIASNVLYIVINALATKQNKTKIF